MFGYLVSGITGLYHRTKNAVSMFFGYYDSAVTSKENYKHWAPAGSRKAVQERNEPVTRDKIAERSRFEFSNNPYLQGMVTNHSTELLGPTGPQLQILTTNSKLNSTIEKMYRDWATHPYVNMAEKLRVLEESRLVEGEGFWNILNDDGLFKELNFRINVNPIAPNRVTDPDNMFKMAKVENGLFNDDGVYYDVNTGRAREFNIVSIAEQLDGLILTNQRKGTKYSAEFVKHWFTPKEAGQTRGLSEIQAAVPLLAFMRRFTLATVSSAELVACMTAFLKTTYQPEEQTAVPPWNETPIVRNMLQSLPEGWEPVVLDQKHPSSTYEMFINILLREIGRVLNMPFGIVSGDSSKYNYSSARLDFLDYQNRLRFFREQLVIKILNPTFRQWLIDAILLEPQIKTAFESGELRYAWQFPTRPSINPLMDAQAEEIRLLNGSITLAEVYADRGKNWEEELEQRKKEVEKIEELGLSFAGMPVAEEIPEDEPTPPTDEEVEDGEPIEEEEEELEPVA